MKLNHLNSMKRVALAASVILAVCFAGVFPGRLLAQAGPDSKAPAADRPTTVKFSCAASCRTPGGRSVNANSEVVPVGVHGEGEVVAVSLGECRFDAAGKMSVDHTVTFESEKVLMDGKERGSISASAREFTVICLTNKVSVMVDKKLLFTARTDK